MDGEDLLNLWRDIGVAKNGAVVFLDSNGKPHEVNGFMRTRIPGGGTLHILTESYGFGFDWKADPWPADLKQYLIEHDFASAEDFV